MKRKVISLLLAGAMAFSLAACGGSGSSADSSAAGSDDKIAMITDSGDITDESFNQITYETVVAYGDDNGIEYQYYKPADDTDEERINAIDLAIAEGATVIVMPGYLFGPAIAEEQDANPDVKFIAADVTEGDVVPQGESEAVEINDNVYLCNFDEEQAGYLAGYAAVKDGYTSLGFLGGIAVPAVVRYGYGYIQGINDAAEELGTDVTVKYTYGGQFYGDEKITAKMEGWYSGGTEVVFACGGGIYTSARDAAGDTGKLIGVDVDQHPTLGDVCITSAMKGLSSAVNSALDAYFSGNWSEIGGKAEQLGLEDGDYIGLPTDEESWLFTTFTQDEYNTVLESIRDGSIEISNSTDEQPAVGSHVTVNYID
ncbi:MAG: BMP family ABC transporter substrate-binding protein [Lachnospiraceae bacterium]|nr:BMP family ABC transporter substrate-binding protein [Lachnospiraceae bacterium]